MFMEKNVNLCEEEVKKNWIKRCVNGLAAATCVAIGYAIGYRCCDAKTNAGIAAACMTDPTLKDHMATAIAETIKTNLTKTN